jgi:hypothetical protein
MFKMVTTLIDGTEDMVDRSLKHCSSVPPLLGIIMTITNLRMI